jgi:hypothetical protein
MLRRCLASLRYEAYARHIRGIYEGSYYLPQLFLKRDTDVLFTKRQQLERLSRKASGQLNNSPNKTAWGVGLPKTGWIQMSAILRVYHICCLESQTGDSFTGHFSAG